METKWSLAYNPDSTVNQLVSIYDTICKALDESKEVRSVFLDMSKVFDRV